MGVTEEEYRQAYLVCKENGVNDIKLSQVVAVNGKAVAIGVRLYIMSQIYRAMQKKKRYGNYENLTEEQIDWWSNQGFDFDLSSHHYHDKDYREAWLIWLETHDKEEEVSKNDFVTFPNGEVIYLGNRLYIMRCIHQAMQNGEHYKKYKDLTEEQITWWTSHGFDITKPIESEKYLCLTEEEYREALLLWQEQNPEKEVIPRDASVIIQNGKPVLIGRRVSVMRSIYQAMQNGENFKKYRNLTEEQIEWWTSHGVRLAKIDRSAGYVLNPFHIPEDKIQKRGYPTEEEYREALLLWQEQNPEKDRIPRDAVVIIQNGKPVPLGRRVSIMRSIYQAMQNGENFEKCRNLTEEQIEWWTSHGVRLAKIDRSAGYVLNPFHIPKEKIKTKGYPREQDYREAFLLWKEHNPNTKHVLVKEEVVLKSGKLVRLGHKIYRMQSVYQAMQNGEKFQKCKDLTEEQIKWWESQGVLVKKKNAISEEERVEAEKLGDPSRPVVVLERKPPIVSPSFDIPYVKPKASFESNKVEKKQSGDISRPIAVPKVRAKVMIKKEKIEEQSLQTNSSFVAVPKEVSKTVSEKEKNQKKTIPDSPNEFKETPKKEQKLTNKSVASVDVYSMEPEVREAFLLWKEQNPKNENVPFTTVVKIKSGKIIRLGRYANRMCHIYDAMQKAEHYEQYKDLTQEQIDWWKNHGFHFNLLSTILENNYRKAYLIWKKEHPGEIIPTTAKVTLENGNVIRLGNRINKMKHIYQAMQEGTHYKNCQDLTKEQIEWWTSHGFDFELSSQCTEEEYQEAFLLWKKQNPKKDSVPRSAQITLENGKVVPLGKRISTMRYILSAMKENKHYGGCKDLTEEQIKWWGEQGVNLEKRENITEEEYREAFFIWRKENPQKKTIPPGVIVTLSNQKPIQLGARFYRLRKIYQSMQEDENYQPNSITKEQIEWWLKQGLVLKQFVQITEEEYQEAFLIWKEQSTEIPFLPKSYIVKIKSGREIDIGQRVYNMKGIYQATKQNKKYQFYRPLKEEQINWWINQGVDFNLMEEISIRDYLNRSAYLRWREQNPEQETVPDNAVVEMENGDTIEIGKQILILRSIYKAMQNGSHFKRYHDLTQEQINWWYLHGVDLKIPAKTKSKQKENKDKQKKTIVEKPIKNRISNREILQQGYLQWKKENPNVKSIPHDATIELKNGKIIKIGRRVAEVRYIYRAMQKGEHYGTKKDLTEEQIKWWKENGLDFEIHKKGKAVKKPTVKKKTPIKKKNPSEVIKEAFLLWKQQHKDRSSVPYDTIVKLPDGTTVELGKKVNTIINIYQAMKLGKNYRNCKKLTPEEISWWEEHGLDWNYMQKVNHSKSVTFPVKYFLQEFDISLEEFEAGLAKTRKGKPKEKITFDDENITLNAFCLKGGYSYKIVSRVMKLHQFCQYDTLEQLVNRIMINDLSKSQSPSTWIYEFYGTSIESILLELELNPSNILMNMSEKIISLEDAICIEVFNHTCKEQEADYLSDYYEDLIKKIDFCKSEQEIVEQVAHAVLSIGKKHNLIKEEIQVLKQSIINYLEKMREYHVIDVGLETNYERKLEKIRKYNLLEDDIEESYFVPFRFESGKLLGRKSELYRRRDLLRQYIIDWDYYTDEEKEHASIEHSFTQSELDTIQNIRLEINHTIEKVKTIGKKVV